MRRPWQAAVVLADAALTPLARRHPWMLTGAAAGVGMALGVLRPWRWLLRPAVLAGLLSPVVAPEAATSLANLVLMPATARDMQNDDLNGFGFEQSKKWLSEQIITPDSMRVITDRLDNKNKKLW